MMAVAQTAILRQARVYIPAYGVANVRSSLTADLHPHLPRPPSSRKTYPSNEQTSSKYIREGSTDPLQRSEF